MQYRQISVENIQIENIQKTASTNDQLSRHGARLWEELEDGLCKILPYSRCHCEGI